MSESRVQLLQVLEDAHAASTPERQLALRRFAATGGGGAASQADEELSFEVLLKNISEEEIAALIQELKEGGVI